MQLLIGLGNPGNTYANHRHNVGFMAMDAIAAMHEFGPEKKSFGGALREGRVGGVKALLFKPLSFMNLSGQPVGECLRFYKIPLEAAHVFHDELDIALGKIRLKTGGGSGGHNGIKSLDAHIGPNYPRIRIGINHPGHKDLVHAHVLSDFSKLERPIVHNLLTHMAEALPLLIQGDSAAYASKVALLQNLPTQGTSSNPLPPHG